MVEKLCGWRRQKICASALIKFSVRNFCLVVFGMLVLFIGPSRVYMGQHWASDAIAGYALGFAYLLTLVELHRWWLRRSMSAEC